MVERQLDEVELCRREVPVAALEVLEHEGRLERRQPLAKLRDRLAPVEVTAAVAVAVGGEQYLWLDLGEEGDQPALARLRGAARPDGADARASQKGRDRLGDVRQVSGDA